MKRVLRMIGRGLLITLDILLLLGTGISVFAVDAFNRVPKRNVQTGREALIGALGVARNEIAPVGLVSVQGELWSAYSGGVIPAGQRVRVARVEGLRLELRKEESTS